MIKITFPDGREQEYESGITGLQIAEKISRNLAKEVLGISVNGDIWDLTRPITQDAKIVLYTFEQEEGKKVMWHSSAHLLAEALEIIYPGVKFGIGPPVANGFYYDVDLGGKEISADDFSKI
ncbi:MAG: TGS domain-containing protein, partial [Bacteroidia bacterium]